MQTVTASFLGRTFPTSRLSSNLDICLASVL